VITPLYWTSVYTTELGYYRWVTEIDLSLFWLINNGVGMTFYSKYNS